MISNDHEMFKRLQRRSDDISKEPLIDLKPICIPTYKHSITLEESMKPLIDILPNIHQFVLMAKEKCSTPTDGLTEDESASIMIYTMDWEPIEECLHYVLNSTLRHEDRDKLKPWFLYLTLLIQALSHLPSISIRVYRQIEYNITERYQLENKFIWWAFSLCSLTNDMFISNHRNDSTIFNIETLSAKDIRKHSFFPNEDQIILMCASQFQIISSFKTLNGENLINLKEMGTNKSLLELINLTTETEILSAKLLLNISDRNIQSRSRVETIEKYINRTLNLQNQIENYPLYSSIDLTNQNLDDQDISLIIQHAILIKKSSILRLDNNFLTSEGINILVNSLYNNKTLFGLNLNSNRLFDKGLYPFVKLLSLNCCVLQKLHLGGNRISNQGVLLLSQILKTNQTLTILWLDKNRISDEGVHYLTDVLIHHNKTLQELSLRKNKFITSLSLPYFIDLFKSNQSLKQIDLTYCSLTKQDNRHLTHLSNPNKRFIVQYDVDENDCIIA